MKTFKAFTIPLFEKKLDKVEPDELDSDFDDREDQDIDNDGDTDDSDKYLHNRRKAIAKAMKESAQLNEKTMKIACLKCDEVSTAKAWEKNNGVCPKCNKSTQGVLEESVKPFKDFAKGDIRLNDGSRVKLNDGDAKLLNQMLNDLNPKNRKEMINILMTDEAGFQEILGFAREAL